MTSRPVLRPRAALAGCAALAASVRRLIEVIRCEINAPVAATRAHVDLAVKLPLGVVRASAHMTPSMEQRFSQRATSPVMG